MKLDFELNKKGETVSDVGEEPTETPSKKSEPITPATTDQNHFNNSMISDNNIGMHWCLIAKMGNIQFLLSCIASMSLLATMNIVGFSMLRFTSSAWTTYLMSTAYIAVRAGKWRSYPHLIAYCGMVMFQTVIYMSSLCWIAYSIYGTEFKLQTLHTGNHNTLLLLVVIELVCLMGTVFTGVFGMIACCRGLGKMLHRIEQIIVDPL